MKGYDFMFSGDRCNNRYGIDLDKGFRMTLPDDRSIDVSPEFMKEFFDDKVYEIARRMANFIDSPDTKYFLQYKTTNELVDGCAMEVNRYFNDLKRSFCNGLCSEDENNKQRDSKLKKRFIEDNPEGLKSNPVRVPGVKPDPNAPIIYPVPKPKKPSEMPIIGDDTPKSPSQIVHSKEEIEQMLEAQGGRIIDKEKQSDNLDKVKRATERLAKEREDAGFTDPNDPGKLNPYVEMSEKDRENLTDEQFSAVVLNAQEDTENGYGLGD